MPQKKRLIPIYYIGYKQRSYYSQHSDKIYVTHKIMALHFCGLLRTFMTVYAFQIKQAHKYVEHICSTYSITCLLW